jgi:hypothetical protein
MRQRFLGLRPLHARTLREIVEVVAILLAGMWALYVFVFENEIRPAFAPPTPSFTVDMRHVGDDRNLAVVRVEVTLRNPGSADVKFLGYALTVLGSKVVAAASPLPAAAADPFDNKLEAYNTYSKAEPVFRDAFVTSQGNPKASRGLFLNAGQTTTLFDEFYVPKGRFDRLVAWLISDYTNSGAIIPTQLAIKSDGRPKFTTSGNAPIYSISAPLAALDLRAQ